MAWDWLPLSPAPEKQSTTHSSVPGVVALTPPVLSRAPTFPSRSAPLIGAVGEATEPDTVLTRVPLRLYSSISADPWKLAGQATVVDQVGTDVSGPVAGFSCRSPGRVPTAASENPAVTRP